MNKPLGCTITTCAPACAMRSNAGASASDLLASSMSVLMPRARAGSIDLALNQRAIGTRRIDQKADAHQSGDGVIREFNQLCVHAFYDAGDSGDAAAWPRIAREEIGKVVAENRADDRQVGCECLCRTSRTRLAGKHHVRRERHELACERPQTFGVPFSITIVDVQGL